MLTQKPFLFTLLALVFVLGACQPAAPLVDENLPAEGAPVAENTEASAQVEADDEEAETTATGGIVRRALTSEPASLDPHGVPSSGQNVLMPYLFDTLIFRDRDNKIHPYLAERWELSEEGKVITFYLKDGVTFTDGSPLDAAAVVFTFDRFKEVGVKSPFYGSLSAIEKVEAVDDLTVRMTLVNPSSTIYSVLSSPYFGIISPGAVEALGEEFGLNPVGSGAFKLENWEPGISLTLVRNNDYNWAPTVFANQGPPHLDALEFPVIPDAAAQMAAMDTGEIDLIFVNEPATISALEEDPNVSVHDVILNSLVYLGFNFQKSPLDELKVRQAIGMAINKSEILENALGGVGEIAFSPLAPSLPGFDPNLKDLELPFDLDASKALLEEAGFAQGEDGIWRRGETALQNLVLLTSTRAPNAEIAAVIQSNLLMLGIPVEIQALDARAATATAGEGAFDLMLWRYDWSDSDILYAYLSTDRLGSTNRNVYSNPELDALLEAALVEVDDVERDQLYSDAQRLLMQDLPWLALYVPRDVIAVRAAVQDVVVGSMGRILLNDAWVSEGMD